MPNKGWSSKLTDHTDLLTKTNSGFWKFKRENDISLRAGLPEAYIAKELKPWVKDLQAMHGIGKIQFGVPKDDGFTEVTLPESEDIIYIRPPEESKE